jgi:hypothetical protein
MNVDINNFIVVEIYRLLKNKFELSTEEIFLKT